MTRNTLFIHKKYRELFFQLVLHILLFLFFSFDRNHPEIQEFQIIAFFNYAFGAFLINYVLLPHLYYKKKYLAFFLSVAIIIALIIAIEELVLEQIYYPNTRGKSFPGVIFSLLDVLPVMTILAGFKFAWDASIKQREVDYLKNLAEESELQFLKSQINPHFLFNNLNNLYSHALTQSPKTPGIILELSSVLRYMLYDCKEKFVPLVKEIEHLKNFTLLNELQIEDRGKVNFESINKEFSFQIAPLILSVFIENAFKHSTASQTDNIQIGIHVAVDDKGVLHFQCKNSFSSKSNTESLSNGIGLKNVKKRLELLYPKKHELVISTNQNTYSVSLTIHLN